MIAKGIKNGLGCFLLYKSEKTNNNCCSCDSNGFFYRVPKDKQNQVDLINNGQFGCLIAGEEGTISKEVK